MAEPAVPGAPPGGGVIHLLCEGSGAVHAAGREQQAAHDQGRDLFAGTTYQVIQVRAGAVPLRGAYPGGQPNPACVWCTGQAGPDGSLWEHCGCLVPCAHRGCGAKAQPAASRAGLDRWLAQQHARRVTELGEYLAAEWEALVAESLPQLGPSGREQVLALMHDVDRMRAAAPARKEKDR